MKNWRIQFRYAERIFCQSFALKQKNVYSAEKQHGAAAGKRKKWRATATAEAKKLSNKEEWNLPTGEAVARTRGGRSVHSNNSLPQRDLLFAVDATDGNSTTVSSITDTSSSPRKKKSKPPPTRVIIEVNKAVALLEKHLANSCPRCSSGLALTFPTTCLASSCRLTCKNVGGCTYADLVEPYGSSLPLADDAGSAKIE